MKLQCSWSLPLLFLLFLISNVSCSSEEATTQSSASSLPSYSSSSPNHPPNVNTTNATTTDTITETTIRDILSQVQAWQDDFHHHQRSSLPTDQHSSPTTNRRMIRPFVLASFAQSLDGMIAPFSSNEDEMHPSDVSGAEEEEMESQDEVSTPSNLLVSQRTRRQFNTTASNYPLSGRESLVLTHALRSIHDGILVGGRTLLIDNPRLSNRLWKNDRQQPIPIVLDTKLRHVQSLSMQLQIQNAIVSCGLLPRKSSLDEKHKDDSQLHQLLQLVPPGSIQELLYCQTIPDSNDDGSSRVRIDLLDVLHQLRTKCGIRTLMVEGGSELLTSLFQQQLVDAACITVCPKVLCGGVSPIFGTAPLDLSSSSTVLLSNGRPALPSFVLLGTDCIFLSRWPRSSQS